MGKFIDRWIEATPVHILRLWFLLFVLGFWTLAISAVLWCAT